MREFIQKNTSDDQTSNNLKTVLVNQPEEMSLLSLYYYEHKKIIDEMFLNQMENYEMMGEIYDQL